MTKRLQSGDRVITHDGPGTVRALDEQTSYVFGKPVRDVWLLVELDGDTTSRRRYLLQNVKPA